MPRLTDLSLAMRTDPLALIRGATEFVTVIYGPAVTFAFPDVKVEAYRRSVLHLNLISAVDGSALNWCEQHALREMMSDDLIFAKTETTVINFDDHFRDRMRELDRGHMTSMMDLIFQEGAAVACAKRRDVLCFFRFMIEQTSVPASNTCVKMLREGDERAKALLLLALLDIHQSKPMRVNMN